MTAPAYEGPTPSIALLMALVLGGVLAINVYVPALPEIALKLAASPGDVQLSITGFMVAFGVAQLALGPLSDRFGRRPVLLGGTVLFVIANVLCAFAVSIEQLILGRVLQGIGACSGSVVTRAIVRDAWGAERSARAMGYLTISTSLGGAVAPVMGGHLAVQFDWTAGFWALAALATIPLAVALVALPETNRPYLRPAGWRHLLADYRRLIRNRAYLGSCLAVGWLNGVFFVFLGSSPFVLIELLGLRPDTYGYFMLFMVVGSLFGSFLAARFGRRGYADRLLIAGCGLTLGGAITITAFGLAGETGVATVVEPLALVGLGNGLTMPLGAARAVGTYPEIAGTASAGFGFIQLMLGAAGASVASLLVHASQTPMGLGMTALALAALGSAVWGLSSPRRTLG
jgi:DHA1 family bicyclomycin/chloramphenicol resistance-like MFS transporter